MDRRAFLLSGAGLVSGLASRDLAGSSAQPAWRMPDESAPHTKTWMAFVADGGIWGEDMVQPVLENLALIARTIARHEPVHVLTPPGLLNLASDLLGESVTLVSAELDDFWIRDTGPTFVVDGTGTLGAVDLNFNGWGRKQRHERDAQVARLVAGQAGATYLAAELVGEGGGIEVDGEGTAIVTESCFISRNRNPGLSRADCEVRLRRALGLDKIIWLPGVRGRDITDGHTDFYARFARPGVVVAGLESDPDSFDYEVTRDHLKILERAVDAKGRPLEVVTLEAPYRIRPEFASDEFAPGYINFYVANGAVLAPEFGDAARDRRCAETLQRLFPSRRIEQLNIDAIASGGGGIHCTTQQEPRSR